MLVNARVLAFTVSELLVYDFPCTLLDSPHTLQRMRRVRITEQRGGGGEGGELRLREL